MFRRSSGGASAMAHSTLHNVAGCGVGGGTGPAPQGGSSNPASAPGPAHVLPRRGALCAGRVAASLIAGVLLLPTVALSQPLAPVLQYDFEEGPASTVFVDSSGFDGSPLSLTKYTTAGIGTLTYSSNVPTSGDGHLFAGSSLRIGPVWSIGHAQPGTNLTHELQQLTVEAWVNVPAGTGGGVVLAHYPRFAACDGRGWSLSVSSTGVGMSIGDQTGDVFFGVGTPVSLIPGRWYHIAGSYDGVTGRVFIDGVERAAAVGNGAIRYDENVGVPACGKGGPTVKTTYLGAVHNNNPSAPVQEGDLRFPLAAGVLLDRIRVLNVAARGVAGVGTPAWELDYFYCKVVLARHPQPAPACPTGAALFSIAASGIGPFTYQWQLEDPASPGNWLLLGNDPGPLPGGGFAFAFPINSPSVSIGVRGRVGAFNVRCVVTNGCGGVNSNPAVLTVCGADVNCDGLVTSSDFFDFLTAFFNNTPGADFNHDGGVNSQDFFDFLAAFFAGC